MHAAARSEDRTGREIFFEFVRLERGRHDDELELGSLRLLQMQGARECDVAIKMTLVEFIEENCGDSAQFRILKQLAEQNSLGDKANPGLARGTFSKRIW